MGASATHYFGLRICTNKILGRLDSGCATTAGPSLVVPATVRAITVPRSHFLKSPALPCLAVDKVHEVTRRPIPAMRIVAKRLGQSLCLYMVFVASTPCLPLPYTQVVIVIHSAHDASGHVVFRPDWVVRSSLQLSGVGPAHASSNGASDARL